MRFIRMCAVLRFYEILDFDVVMYRDCIRHVSQTRLVWIHVMCPCVVVDNWFPKVYFGTVFASQPHVAFQIKVIVGCFWFLRFIVVVFPDTNRIVLSKNPFDTVACEKFIVGINVMLDECVGVVFEVFVDDTFDNQISVYVPPFIVFIHL